MSEQAFFKCSGCECIFFVLSDRDRHVGKFGYGKHIDAFKELHSKMEYGSGEDEILVWRKSTWGEGEICLAETFPQIAMACRIQNKVSDAQYNYKLCGQTGKWLKRVPISCGK